MISFRLAQVVVRVLARKYESFLPGFQDFIHLKGIIFIEVGLGQKNNIGNVAVRWPGNSQQKY